MSVVVDWIRHHAAGRTFVDIGGIGLNSLNERISVAVQAGAAEATMADFRRFGFPEWDVFDGKMSDMGIAGYRKIDGVNLEAREFPDRVGRFDFVHCMGVIYHAPAPMVMLDNLSRITGELLIVNTVIVPEKIETEIGELSYPGAEVLFLPALSEREREILEAYYQSLLNWPPGRFSSYAPRISDPDCQMPWLQTRALSDRHFWGDKGDMSYSPYWFLFTKQAFRAAVRMFGFRILDETSFKGHTLTLLCERSHGS